MAAAGTGAVFFLGTRAHYQAAPPKRSIKQIVSIPKVLQQPESQFDVANGNASTETIYQNPSVQDLWGKENSAPNYMNGEPGSYCTNGTISESEVKRRIKRRSSETALCEDMKPAALNNVDNATPKSKQSRTSLLTFLSSLSRWKKLRNEERQYIRDLESSVLTDCSYRESCRCLDCQSRYFECDEEEEDYSSEDESEFNYYLAQSKQPPVTPPPEESDEDDDEVFIDKVLGDNTSTDMLLEPKKMSVSSVDSDETDAIDLGVAAGAPVLLNYLLTHPITCSIQ